MAVAAWLVSQPLASQAQDATIPAAKASLAATCAACHQPATDPQVASPIPSLVNLNAKEIESRMLAFKNDSLQGTIMPQLAKGYTDEQIRDIAEYLGQKQGL